ncbi:MAG: DUF2059 domain-containing protein [Zoogloeaceae bacterium]|nr:DUF2059 domain-containing protein [Zoogloeaceae bacterium]
MNLLRYDEQFRQIHENCLASAKSLPLESLFSPDELKTSGIKPGSKEWAAAVKEYEAYYTKVCDKPSKEEFLEALASVYREKLSNAELQQAIAFYSSAAGKKLVAAHKLASYRVTELISDAQAHEIPSAAVELKSKLSAIGQRARRAGRE